MGWIEKWVNFETEEQIAKRKKEYDAKIFPYGEQQKRSVVELLRQTLASYDDMSLYNYLVIKQGLMAMKEKQIDEDVLKRIKKSVRNTFKGNKEDLYVHIALALCDLKIDERLDYPDPDTLSDEAVSIKKNR